MARVSAIREEVLLQQGQYSGNNDATVAESASISTVDDKEKRGNQITGILFHNVQASFDLPLHAQLTDYTQHSEVNALSEAQVQEIQLRNRIVVAGSKVPRPVQYFAHCGIPTKLLENLHNAGFMRPTPIQMQTIPAGLAGRDVLATAETRSGKTLSFLIPLIVHAWALSIFYDGKNGPYVLIIAPTRELCAQIESQAKTLIMGLPNMRTSLIVGGVPMPNQAYRLRQGTQIAVATPGRLLELFQQYGDLIMKNIYLLVLDEVDMMFKMGFDKQLRELFNILPQPSVCPWRQLLMFSATLPADIWALVDDMLRDPVYVSVNVTSSIASYCKEGAGKEGGQTTTLFKLVPSTPSKATVASSDLFSRTPVLGVKQTVLWVENQSKKKQLFSLLNNPKYFRPPILIFVESKMGADLLADAIAKKCGASVASMHSDKSQEVRTTTLQAFLRGQYEVLVATGVMSRGINLPDVRMVVLFDMAVSVVEFVHQVGRAAARYGDRQDGWAVTFINEDHKHLFKVLTTILKHQPPGRVTPLPSKLLSHGYTLYGKR